MGDSLVAIGGWGFSTQILKPLFNTESRVTFIDPHAIFPRLVVDGRLREDWVELVADALMPMLPFHNQTLLLGWSCGSMIAGALLPQVNPEVFISLSGCLSFCRRPGHTAGWRTPILNSMIERLRQDRRAVLEDFYIRCGIDRADLASTIAASNSIETSALAAGLVFLRDALVDPVWLESTSKVMAFHGIDDKIISPESGKALAGSSRGSFVPVDGGHTFFTLEHNAELVRGSMRIFKGQPQQ